MIPLSPFVSAPSKEGALPQLINSQRAAMRFTHAPQLPLPALALPRMEETEEINGNYEG